MSLQRHSAAATTYQTDESWEIWGQRSASFKHVTVASQLKARREDCESAGGVAVFVRIWAQQACGLLESMPDSLHV